MSQAVAEAVVPVLSEIPAAVARGVASAQQQGHLACGRCVMRRARFRRLHGDEIQSAWERAAEAAAEGEPPDITPFLPEHLRPDPANPVDDDRLPTSFPAVTQIGGTLYCEWDVTVLEVADAAHAGPPQQPPGQPGVPRKQFLIANSSDVGAVAREAARTPPGFPAVPGQ